MRGSNFFAVAVAVTLLALPIAAADNGFYLGGSIGQSSFTTGDLEDVEFDGDATGYKVFMGGRFITFLGLEASYVDFGDIEDDQSAVGYQVEATGLTLQAVGYLPLGIADLFAKGGLFQESEITLSGSGPGAAVSSDDETAPVYGAGVQFRIKSFAIRAEVEYYDVDMADELYMISVGGSYTF
jgi:hypothetical protein